MSDGGRLGELLFTSLDQEAEQLARRWLDRIVEELPERPERVFPDSTLQDHIPQLLRKLVAAARGEEEALGREVVGELHSLVRLRRGQGYTVNEIIREFDLLTELLSIAIEEVCETTFSEQDRFGIADVLVALRCARRLHGVVNQMAAITREAFEHGVTSNRLERSQVLDDFGRAITHELRNRLNSVNLAMELCRTHLYDPSALEAALDRTMAQLSRAASVVGDVFSVAIAHGRAHPVGDTMRPLADVVTATLSDFEDYARSSGVELEIVEPVPGFVVDTSRVQLAFVNLISNAIKYANLEHSRPLVRVRVEKGRAPGVWCVRVEDNGIGIPVEERQLVFERQRRGTQVGDREGHGLGLSMAKEVAAQLGGRIWIEDGIESGTAVCFELREPRATFDGEE